MNVDYDVTMPELLSKVQGLEQRLARLEEFVNIGRWDAGDTSSRPINSMWQSDDLAEIRNLVRSGKKIPAIKRYRELKGVGLAEAKEAVEALERP